MYERARSASLAVLVLAIASCLLPASVSWSGPIRVYIMAGQSNMVGGATDPPLASYSPQPNVKYQYRLGTSVEVNSSSWEVLRTLQGVSPGLTYGSELTFAKSMDDRVAEPIAIIKAAANGTSLWRNWDPISGTHPYSTNGLYHWMMDKVQLSLEQLADEGYTPQIAGFVWVQGEGDANLADKAELYDDNLAKLANALRTDLGIPNLPFLLNELHQDLARPFVDVVRASQRAAAAADPYMHLVNADDLALGPDSVHFTGAMHNELGRRFADVLSPSADFNYDGLVNHADLAVWKMAAGTNRTGDANSDGIADGADFLLWQRQVSSASVASAIPEPATVSAAATGLTLIVCSKRLRERRAYFNAARGARDRRPSTSPSTSDEKT